MKKIVSVIISACIMLLPTIIFIGSWLLLKPITFWQRLIIIFIGSSLLLSIQTWLFIFWLAFLTTLFNEVKDKKIKVKRKQAKNRIEDLL